MKIRRRKKPKHNLCPYCKTELETIYEFEHGALLKQCNSCSYKYYK